MSKFSAPPKLQRSEEAFVKGAEAPRAVKVAPVATIAPAPTTKVAAAPNTEPVVATSAGQGTWANLDAGAKKVASTQPLRLNAYQYEQLKWLAETQDRSLSHVLRRLVGPTLEAAVLAESEQ